MTNKIQKLIDKYPDASQDALVKEKLDKMKLNKLNNEEKELWYCVRGSLEFQEGVLHKALEVFKRGIEEFPNSPNINFNIGSNYEQLGAIKEASKHFENALQFPLGSQKLLHISRIGYLWDFYDLGLTALEPIFRHYYELGIADDNFLYMRGLPFYGETFPYKAVLAKLSSNFKIAKIELANSKEKLMDFDFSYIEQKFEAFVSDNYEDVLMSLKESLKNQTEDFSMNGFSVTLKAVIESRKAANYEDAIQILDTVEITPYDFTWLEDVLIQLKAELASKFKKDQEEQKFKNLFFERQPMLFEPNHVFNFGLDKYQEKLKKIYTQRKKQQSGA